MFRGKCCAVQSSFLIPAQSGPSQKPFTSATTLPLPSPRTLTMFAARVSGVFASMVICVVEACGSGQVCSITSLVADFDKTLRVHWLSFLSDRMMRSWSRSSCDTQALCEIVTGLPARAFMASSTLARFSGGMLASASGGSGLPTNSVLMLICHAPGLTLKEAASVGKEIAIASAAAIVISDLDNMASALPGLASGNFFQQLACFARRIAVGVTLDQLLPRTLGGLGIPEREVRFSDQQPGVGCLLALGIFRQEIFFGRDRRREIALTP